MAGERSKIMEEDEMTEAHMAKTEAEYRAVTRQEIRDQRLADERAECNARASANFSMIYAFLFSSR